MFISANKKIKEKLPWYILFCLFGICALCATAFIFFSNGKPAPDFATCDELGKYSLKAETVEEQKDFFLNMGYEIDETTLVSDSVIIPEKFSNIYENYNNLQKQSGLDLTSYKGIKVLRNVYKLNKYKKTDGSYYATILIYKGSIIGGHIGQKIYESEYYPLK